MCKYEMSQTSIVEDTVQTQFCNRWLEVETDQVEPVYSPFQLSWSMGYNKS